MRALALVLLLTFAAASPAAAPPAELPPAQQARYEALTHELRCLVCQNETIADSSAELADDLRRQVYAQVAAGKSDAEIKRYLTDRYGDFVLYRPPFKPLTWLLWAGPFAVLLIALLIAVRFARGRRRGAPPSLDNAALARLIDGEQDENQHSAKGPST